MGFLNTFPERDKDSRPIPPHIRIRRAIAFPGFPGGHNFEALRHLYLNTLARHFDGNNPEQVAALQAIATKAIGLQYNLWKEFHEDLLVYLQCFGYVQARAA